MQSPAVGNLPSLKLKILAVAALKHPDTDGDPLQGRFSGSAEISRGLTGATTLDQRYRQFFGGSLMPGEEFRVDFDAATQPGGPQSLPACTLWPRHRERLSAAGALLVPPHGTQVRLALGVEPERADPSLDVMFSSGGRQTEIELTVSGSETYEEYYRVTQEAQDVLARAPAEIRLAPRRLAAALAGTASTQEWHAAVQGEGERLFIDAVKAVQAHRMDDRALYHARLQAVVLLRQRAAADGRDASALVACYERASRGITRIAFPSGGRRVLVTGFDPFHLDRLPGRGNPSGLAALSLHGRTLGDAAIQACLFPIRWDDFDAGLVEEAVRPVIDDIDLLVTLSQGAPREKHHYYDIERFAGKRRGRGHVRDNNNQIRPPVNGEFQVPHSLDADPDDAPEYIETTLPHSAVVDAGNLVLPGPGGPTCFVLNQGFRQAGGPARPDSAEGTSDAFIASPPVPDLRRPSETGSGGGYLSNEVFYRTALLRQNRRGTLPSGHLHLPILVDTDPATAPARQLLQGVEEALTRMLRACP